MLRQLALWKPLHTPRKALHGHEFFNPLLSKRYLTQKIPHKGADSDLSPERRFISIIVAFGVGCSIYFFLDDPRQPRKKESPTLSPRRFSPARLVHSQDSTPNTKLIELAIPPDLLPQENYDFHPIWAVYIKDDDIQVERPYTPLHGISKDGRMQFWIKKYPNGEVGRWLHSKKINDTIEIRGPLTTWPWKEGAWDEVVLISGGTGITPFVQLFNTTIAKLPPDLNMRFTLLHSSRTPGELPPPQLLNSLTAFAKEHPQRFRFHVFVDEDDGTKAAASTPPLNIGRITEKSLKECVFRKDPFISWWTSLFTKPQPKTAGTTKNIMFLVCGPESMVGAIAGPYGRNLSQGAIGGILGNLGYTSNQVYKL